LDLERETSDLALTRLIGALGEEDIVAGIRYLAIYLRTAVTTGSESEGSNQANGNPD